MAKATIKQKRCPGCETYRPLRDFHNSERNGVQSRCKICRNDYRKAYRPKPRKVLSKVCLRCGKRKKAKAFSKRSDTPSGLRAHCRACQAKTAKQQGYKHSFEIPFAELTLTDRDIARFWSKVDKSPGQGPKGRCWEYTGGRYDTGYGAFSIQGRNFSAARVALWISTGVNPADKQACHTCDNPPCCNPADIFPGMPIDNTRDMLKKGRCRPPEIPFEVRSQARRKVVLNRIHREK